MQYCQARLVQGRVASVVADTVVFSSVSRVDPSTPFDPLCHDDGAARLVMPAARAVIVSERRRDVARTTGTVLMAGLAVAMFFF